MVLLSYNKENDEFFVAASFKEFRVLQKTYNFLNGDYDYKEARMRKKRSEINPSDNYYENMVKNMYNIYFMPDICFVVNRNLSKFVIMKHSYPYNYKWASFSPWKDVERLIFTNLEDLKTLNR